MVIQFEDVVDVLRALHGQTYEYIFYFYHSSGHDKTRPKGLNVSTMNKGYGGGQNEMRSSTIIDNAYLGEFNHEEKLKVGDIQFMQYQDDDAGPFHLNDAKKRTTKI